uniref:RNA-directed RNA polymerase L n=1 Tax=Soybean cyst nematode nyami-like virus TaxID=2107712 RepID=A0A2P1CXU9_9MONO|nr:RNA-dependent RNA polymerase [Soybean cyst nematode nyami-like virus]AVK42870.1 RNA-dependent RNA polymerase [Soybean cyst nematode nyami-like virus]
MENQSADPLDPLTGFLEQHTPARRSPIYRQDMHLANALLYTEIDFLWQFKNRPRQWFSHRTLSAACRQVPPQWVQDRNMTIPVIQLTTLLSQSCKPERKSADLLRKQIGVATKAWKWGRAMVLQGDDPLNVDQLTTECTRLASDPTVLHLLAIRNETRRIIKTAGKRNNDVKLTAGDIEFSFSGNLGLWWNGTTPNLDPWATFCCLNDICSGRFTTYLYSRIADILDPHPAGQRAPLVLRTFREMDSAVHRHGNMAYDLFKVLPSLVIGRFLSEEEPETGVAFLETLLKGLDEKKPLSKEPLTITFTTFDTKHETALYLELAGLWKCAGHPIIDVTAGIKKVHERGGYMTPGISAAAEGIGHEFKYQFCLEYWQRHKKWPPLRMTTETAPLLRTAYAKGTWPSGRIAPSDFSTVRFEKLFNFDYNPDLLELIEDKSIIPELAAWPDEYSRAARLTLHGREPRLATTRNQTKRLVMAYLCDPEPSLKRVIETIEETGCLHRSDLVIVLIFKERELKREGRLFAKATFPARLFQAGTERAVSNDILPYFPYQSMTLTEQQLANRLAIYSDQLKPTATRKFVAIVLDFSGWNLRFRHETMSPLYRAFDDLYGFRNVFKYSQLLPLSSVILIKDEFRPPKMNTTTGLPEPCLTSWFGNESWFEGMRQKPWTLATMMLILGIARELKTHVSLTGQGDNQVILLSIPADSELRLLRQSPLQYAKSFLHKLTAKCDAAGIQLKPEETWISSRILEYARQYYIDGVQVPSTLKRMTRLHSLTNEDFPTLASDVSTVYSAGCSAANLSTSPDAVFLMTSIEALEAIHYRWPEFVEKADPDYLAVLLSTNRTLGGLPCSLYPDFLVRSLPDPLTNNISLHHVIWNLTPPARTALWNMRPLPSRHVDPAMLVRDPVSLPLLIPVQAENFIRRSLERTLRTVAINKMVVRLLDHDADIAETNLIQDLLAIHPFNPKVAHELYLLSNVGLRVKLLGRFYKARSLAQASSTDVSTITTIVKQHEDRSLQFYTARQLGQAPDYQPIDLFKGATLHPTGWCSTQIARQLRQEWWGIRIEGVTQAPPWEQTYVCRFSTIPSRLLSSTLLYDVVYSPDTKSPRDLLWSRGRMIPYLGSQTREKYKKPVLQTAEVGTLLSSIKRIVTVFEWLRNFSDDHMVLLRDSLLSEKTDIGIHDLELVAPRVYGGCPTHRLHARAVPSGSSLCGVMTFSTHLRFSSSGATAFARSTDNYTIMFQQLFLYATANLALRSAANQPTQGEWGQIILCPGCTEFIPDTRVSLLRPPAYPGIHCFNKITTLTLKTQLPGLAPTAINSRVEAASLIAYRAVTAMESEDALQAYTYEHPEATSPGTLYPLADIARADFKTILACIASYMDTLTSLTTSQPMTDQDTPEEQAFLELYLAPELILDPRTLPLQTLARATHCSGRTWELFQICPTLARTHNSTVTIKGVSHLLLQALRVLRQNRGAPAFLTANIVPFDVPPAVFIRQWQRAIVALHPQSRMLLAALRRCTPSFTNVELSMANPFGILTDLKNEGVLSEAETTQLAAYMPQRTRPEGIVIDDLRQLPADIPLVHPTRLRLPPYADNCLLIKVEVINDPAEESAYIPAAPQRGERQRLCHLARPVGNISTSISKILDVLAACADISIAQVGLAVTLAEGAGSILSGLLHLYPTLFGFYNSLLPGTDRGDDPCVYYPPTVMADQCGLCDRLFGIDEMRAGHRDLTQPETIDKIVDAVKRQSFSVSVITMDAEVTDQSTYSQLMFSTLEIIRRLAQPLTVLVIKLFLLTDEVNLLISVIRQSFGVMYLMKPPASDRDSTELYLVAQHFYAERWPSTPTTTRGGNDAVRRFCAARERLLRLSHEDYVELLMSDGVRLFRAIEECPCLSTARSAMANLGVSSLTDQPINDLERLGVSLTKAIIDLPFATYESVDSHALLKHVAYRKNVSHIQAALTRLAEVDLALALLTCAPRELATTLADLTQQTQPPSIHYHVKKQRRVCRGATCTGNLIRVEEPTSKLIGQILRSVLHIYPLCHPVPTARRSRHLHATVGRALPMQGR